MAGLLVILLAVSLQAADSQAPVNVNSRYLVESVDISGGGKTRISRGLREDIEKLVGNKLNSALLEKLAGRIRRELNARRVTHKLVRGTQPEQVIVLFEVSGRRPRSNIDFLLRKGLYHAKQGWTGALDSKVTVGDSEFTLGVVSDGDALLERYAGLHAGYEYTRLGTDRVHLGFQFASYHQKWNAATGTAVADSPDVPGVYRTRQEFAPALTVLLAEPLTLTVGTSFQRFQSQFPAARTEAANTVTTSLRYARRLEDAHNNRHEVKAGYNLRAATGALGADYVYSRHAADFSYAFTRNRHRLEAGFLAGRTGGTPPLFDRFVLGNSATLRGWNKFDVAPLGGTRVVHGSASYGYAWFHVFYDAGALWDKHHDTEAKHSLGAGIRTKGGFYLALAFPLRSGRADPVFLTGMGL